MTKSTGPTFGKTKVGKKSKKKELLLLARRFRSPSLSVRQAIFKFYESLGTPVALSCKLLYEAGEYEQLVQKDIDPRNYADPYLFRDDFAAISFLRKNQFLKTGIDTRAVAISSFHDSERACKVTNDRFRNLALDPSFKGPNVWLLNAVARKIARIIGEFHGHMYDELLDRGLFGPGTTYHVRGEDTSLETKFQQEGGITSSLYGIVKDILPLAYPGWFTQEKLESLTLQDASRVDTVKKNAKTDRTIAIEPGINTWFQKGLGSILRRKLLRAGFNLNSDLKNQRAAYLGSIDDKIATMDMKAASDTISSGLVREILPPSWYRILEACRTQKYELDGTTAEFEKFSSMGNGFTFELESLIFVAAALSCTEFVDGDLDQVSVFGDDITLPVEAAGIYTEFCTFLGFTVNNEKSFSSGCFRESCGSYYFSGVDAKPIFLKEYPSNVERVYNLANSLRHLAHSRTYGIGCDARFHVPYQSLIDMLPKPLRLFGATNTDGVIHANFDEANPVKCRDGHEGFTFMSFLHQPVSYHSDQHGVFLARLRVSSDTYKGNKITLRRRTILRLKPVRAAQWYNFGPWI